MACYAYRMAKKDTSDPIIFAHSVLDQIIAKHDPEVAREQGKNPHAVALGKRGGSKGAMPVQRALQPSNARR
jgi:hypothetical protein